ncbi:hypothetical protein VNI00_004915 [Paramarasmius palmivorus]|uniref:Cupin type-1 domain-containing protein n=1 Tax=Paramarasmius palmivorus TaxID=297713 RepID=A0AAW0DLM5_9AGAR
MAPIRSSTLIALLGFCRLACAAPTLASLSSVASLSSAVSSGVAASSSIVSTSSLELSASFSAAEPSATVSFASTNPNFPMWGPDSPPSVPEPERGSLGASIMGPSNPPLELQNPAMLAPPTTDNGEVGNPKWSFSLSPNRIQTGGWARQQNVKVMPIAENLAAVDMRLEAGAIRELHWHDTSEWAYVLKGTAQVTSIDTEGRNFRGNVGPGDLWFFPAGLPHSLQATNEDPDGCEFLLIFPDGNFSEDDTFLLTDWLAHVPAEVIQKNFQLNSSKPFSHIPAKPLYIFPWTQASAAPNTAEPVSDPNGQVPQSFTYAFSNVTATPLAGGSVKVVDSRTFPVSTTISAAEVTVEPNALRELHWHPTMDEWGFILEGQARITVFASQSNAKTFNYQAGDIAYIPASFDDTYTNPGHYVENTGNTTLKFLEIFNTSEILSRSNFVSLINAFPDIYQDVSLTQWLAVTPPELLKAHLDLDDETIAHLNKTKATVVAPLIVDGHAM